MADAGSALKAYVDGQLSLEALLGWVDRLVAAGDDERENMAALIGDPGWRVQLGPDVAATIERRLVAGRGSAPAPMQPSDGDEMTEIVNPNGGEFRVGATVRGRFELVEELGEGGMSKVFKALDRVRAEAKDRQPYVAIKVLSQVVRQSPHSVIALQREAKKALSLAHPNIVRVYDFDRAGPNFYMTMEYLRGRSLDKIIRAPGYAGLPLERVLTLIEPAAAALSHAHQNGIVHADLKPSNIFLTDDEQVKVIDFGIARAIEEPGADGERTVFDPSVLGALTPRYASPEQCAGAPADRRDDVYAFACVIYELLTGKHPFDGLSGLQAHVRQVQPARPPMLDLRHWEVLKRGFAFDRTARTASVAELIAGLKRGGGWLTGPRIAAAVAALVVVGALVGAAALFLLPGDERSASTPPTPPPIPAPTPVEVVTPSQPVTQPPPPVAVSPPLPSAVQPSTVQPSAVLPGAVQPSAVAPEVPVVVRTPPEPVGEAPPAEGKASDAPPAATAVIAPPQPPKPSAAPQRPQKAAAPPPAAKKKEEPRPPAQSRPAAGRCQDILTRIQLGEPLSASDRRVLREECQ